MKKQNIVSVELPTAVGNFRLHVWDGDRGRELVALSTPTLDAAREIMVRVHSECLTGDIFRSLACDCGPQKDLALQKIQEHGNGIFIYHRQEGRNTGLYKKVQSYNLMQQGMDTHDALLSLVGHPDPREYSDILTALSQLLDNKKSHIRLLSNNPYKALFLERYGYQVALEPLRTATSLHSAAYTDAKTQKFLHNTVGYAPYTSITLSRGDIQQRLPSIATILSSVHPWIEARKLFIGLGMYPEKGDLSDAKLQSELETLHARVSKVQNAHLVLHMDYPLSRSAQRELKRFLGKLAFPYSLQFRLPISAPEGRIDVELIDSFHGEHVIFQLKEEHFTLLEQKGFIDYFSSPNKFLLLDESWAKGTREDVAIKKTRILKLISRGLSRIAVAGGYGADNAPEIHELEDFFKLPISVDAESQLRTDGYVDEVKAAAYLSFFFQSTT